VSHATEPSAIAQGDHVVQFYKRDADLVGSVGGYLVDAAQRASVSVVIATDAHRESFAAHLSAHGVDAAAAEREGSLVLLDAAATLARFMPGGRIDRAAFFDVVGGVIRDAGATGRPVRAYGEMVALLWEAGDVLAAIDLEKLWNELASDLPFSLYCAYHSDSVEGHEHTAALYEVCRLHGGVIPESPVDVTADFPAERSAATAARHLASGALRSWGYEQSVVEDAELVVTELAANAILHARTSFRVTVQRCGPLARIAVRDHARALPAVLDPEPTRPSGRGMLLVSAVSRRWGVEVTAEGKTVWAELGR
jgi:anti-sigma regulatory factor (Ser/Thr protein kinase)